MIKKLTIFIIPVLTVFLFGLKPTDKPSGTQPYQMANNNPNQIFAVDSKKLDANQISTWFRTNGSFNRNPITGDAGFEWPKESNKFARYASGLWLGAMVGGQLRVAIAEYDYEYLPGFVDDNGNPQGQDDPNYRIYTLYSDGTGDWDNWPVDQGAYVDSLGNPFILGGQTQFYVYTDGYPEAHNARAGSTPPLKAQILQTNWSYSISGPMGNMAFTEFKVINRSSVPWDDSYIAVWTDDDIGTNFTNDLTGCDTIFNLGFTYKSVPSDPQYPISPAVGYSYFRGPIIPSPGDTVSYFSPPGSNNLVEKVGFRELGLTAFNSYNNDGSPIGNPNNAQEVYWNLQGIKRSGDPWINPLTNQVTTFCFPGDPNNTPTGWIETENTDKRFLQSSGPFTMNPGDTQIIIVAQLIAVGTNNLTSITALKQTNLLARRIYDLNFQVPDPAPCAGNLTAYAPGDGKVYLSWDDSAERLDTIENKFSGGRYKFQGYNIYQIRPGTNGANPDERILLATFDVIDDVTDIYDSVFIQDLNGWAWARVQIGYDNGISRYFIVDKDHYTNGPIISGTPYQFSVTSYFYDSTASPFNTTQKLNEAAVENCVITVIPQRLSLGTQTTYNFGDTILTNQKDLSVIPIVLRPLEMRTALYSYIKQGSGASMTWRLDRTIEGSTTTILQSSDFSGLQDTARIVDGMLIISNTVTDSGIVKDKDDPLRLERNIFTITGAWEYDPPGNIWFSGPDTTAIMTIPSNALFRGRQFQSRSIGMSFPTSNSFRGLVTRVKANGSYFIPGTGANTLLTGGPLRKIQLVFGPSHTSMAYRYAPSTNVLESDTNLLLTPYIDMVSVPFSVFAVDELDSSNGAPRRLNIAFVDADNNGLWDPDTTELGKFQITYILASDYSETPNSEYTSRLIGLPSPINGFGSFDIMYVWVPRVRTVGGAPMSYADGDRLTVWPYRPNRGDFVPGYPVRYDWNIQGPELNNTALISRDIDKIKVFPNPYYGGSRLETDPFDRFVYFSNLPPRATIYIYTLDGVLVRKLERESSDPNSSLEKWDLQNSESIPVATGMYIVYIDAKDAGVKVLKVAIFTPQERLDVF